MIRCRGRRGARGGEEQATPCRDCISDAPAGRRCVMDSRAPAFAVAAWGARRVRVLSTQADAPLRYSLRIVLRRVTRGLPVVRSGVGAVLRSAHVSWTRTRRGSAAVRQEERGDRGKEDVASSCHDRARQARSMPAVRRRACRGNSWLDCSATSSDMLRERESAVLAAVGSCAACSQRARGGPSRAERKDAATERGRLRHAPRRRCGPRGRRHGRPDATCLRPCGGRPEADSRRSSRSLPPYGESVRPSSALVNDANPHWGIFPTRC